MDRGHKYVNEIANGKDVRCQNTEYRIQERAF